MEGHTHREKEADRFSNEKWHKSKPDSPYPYMQDLTMRIDDKLRKFAKMRRFTSQRKITASGAKAFAERIGLLSYVQTHDSDFLRSHVVWSEVAAFWMVQFQEWLDFEVEKETQ